MIQAGPGVQLGTVGKQAIVGVVQRAQGVGDGAGGVGRLFDGERLAVGHKGRGQRRKSQRRVAIRVLQVITLDDRAVHRGNGGKVTDASQEAEGSGARDRRGEGQALLPEGGAYGSGR